MNKKILLHVIASHFRKKLSLNEIIYRANPSWSILFPTDMITVVLYKMYV